MTGKPVLLFLTRTAIFGWMRGFRKIQVLAVILQLFFGVNSLAQDTTTITPDLQIQQLSEQVFVHISWVQSETYGRFSSNGMIYLIDDEVWLFDTPMNDSTTELLLQWITETKRWEIMGFVPNHWHDDCTAGMDILEKREIEMLVLHQTNELLIEHDLPIATTTFKQSVIIPFVTNSIVCDYPGAGHAADNIVVWLPDEKVLFGGCMVKSADSRSLGNLSHANLEQWPSTLQAVLDKYPTATNVIPGHGPVGDLGLLQHTLQLLKQPKD